MKNVKIMKMTCDAQEKAYIYILFLNVRNKKGTYYKKEKKIRKNCKNYKKLIKK